jgi:hypothetical protein
MTTGMRRYRKCSLRRARMPSEPIFYHLSDNARRFAEFHRRWSVDAFYIQLNAMTVLALESVRQGRSKDAHWQSMAAFKFAREIERQKMEIGEVVCS